MRLKMFSICVAVIACILAVTALAATKGYFEYPETSVLRDESRFLMYDNLSGSRNFTGAAFKRTFADRSKFDNITGHQNRSDNPHAVTASQVGSPTLAAFVNLSGHQNLRNNPHSITALQTGAESMHGVSTPGNMSWSDATRTLTISGLSYYYLGTLVSSISTTAQITTTTGMWFISFDSTSGLLSTSQSAWNLYTQVPVATVWWNGTAGAVISERHSHLRSLPFHAWAHYSVGTRYGSGIDMIAPALNTPSTVSFTSGSVWDEDLQATIGATTSVRLWYETAAGVWTWTTSSSLYGTTMRYVDTPSYTLTNYTTSQYGVIWVYATPDLSVPIYAMIESRVAPYANTAAARAALPPNLFGTGITPELKLLYRVIFRGDETFTEAADYRNSSVLPAGGTASTTAASVTLAPVTGITATNVQSAIELLINIDGGTW